MLRKIENNILHLVCNKCKTPYQETVNGRSYNLLEDGTQYENYNTEPCPSCGRASVFILNIPVDEMAEYEAELNVMPFAEIDQRYYVRKLIRMVRADFKEGN